MSLLKFLRSSNHISQYSASEPAGSGKGTFLGKIPFGMPLTSTHKAEDASDVAYSKASSDDDISSRLGRVRNDHEYNIGDPGSSKRDMLIQNTTNYGFNSVDTTDSSYIGMFPFDCAFNESFCTTNETFGGNMSGLNGTTTDSNSDTGMELEYRYWTLFLCVFPFFTVFGNVLVVMSIYRERSLRNVTNYFICSLAIADIMVAVMVMPFAVYMEVVHQIWSLSDPLCDAWVASDVMACTASILNLTAISVDRFIAVTQPIKYLKHKNSNRVFVTLGLTWVISIAIAAPIALGVNYSVLRKPGACAFFNSDFLIYSSMGSFVIPSLIMIFLYWRIYRVLHIRARAAARSKKAKALKKPPSATHVIANPATVQLPAAEPTVTTGLAASMDNGKISSYNTNKGQNTLTLPVQDDASVTNVATNTDSQSSERFNEDESVPKSPGSVDDLDDEDDENDNKAGALIVNRVAVREVEVQIGGNGNGMCNTSICTENETHFGTPVQRVIIDQATPDTTTIVKSPGLRKALPNRRKEKKGGGKFNFHMRTSRKRKEKSSSKREKKATKTLAIVLGVFLLCWVPFFTINIMNAICIRYDLFDLSMCNIHGVLFSFFVWLGYINSFLNPVIYTIFNPEFRKAFKKILTERC